MELPESPDLSIKTAACKSCSGTSAMVHRGPDDEGAWAEDGFGFGMRRLSIIDLSGGHQPMWDERTGLGVVFNEKTYNYRDLRQALGPEKFRTHSDTEVVLRSLGISDLSAVQSWNGMFAVAAWDPREKKLLLLRDLLRRFCARRIPPEILIRPKRGFPVPAYAWLQDGLSGWAKEMLLGRESRTARAFCHTGVKSLIERSAAGDPGSAHNVWSLLILEQWLRAWGADLA